MVPDHGAAMLNRLIPKQFMAAAQVQTIVVKRLIVNHYKKTLLLLVILP